MSRFLAGLALLGLLLLGLPLAAACALAAVSVPGSPVVDGSASGVSSASGLGGSVAGRRVVGWADTRVGQAYRMGADGPTVWDCSSFTRAAWARAGVRLPRLAQAQRDWLAAGHGTRITPGAEQPGDLVFWDSYLGPATIGHVVLVADPTRHATIEARSTRQGVGHFTYQPHHHLYEIWRPRFERRP